MAREIGPRVDLRKPFVWQWEAYGVVWDLHFEADPRDVRRWCVSRNGQPWMRCGLEQVWRAMQREMARPLGRRSWGP